MYNNILELKYKFNKTITLVKKKNQTQIALINTDLDKLNYTNLPLANILLWNFFLESIIFVLIGANSCPKITIVFTLSNANIFYR